MALEYSVPGGYRITSTGRNEFMIGGRFDTNTTNAPDGELPLRAGVTPARTGTGIFTVTLSPAPTTIVYGDATVWGDKPGIHAKLISYSAGVLTIHVYDEDDVSGIQAIADTDNVTVCWWAVFTSDAV